MIGVTFLRLLLFAVFVLSMAGCADPWSRVIPPAYYRVRVTNPRGELVADWVAVGFVARTETGYRFRAVERLSAPPHMQSIRYPEGRQVEASGPNIIVARCPEPLWLYEMKRRD